MSARLITTLYGGVCFGIGLGVGYLGWGNLSHDYPIAYIGILGVTVGSGGYFLKSVPSLPKTQREIERANKGKLEMKVETKK